jgi:predicted RNase H-like HicB family nuclease
MRHLKPQRRPVSVIARGRDAGGSPGSAEGWRGRGCGPLARSAGGYPESMPEMPHTLTAALHQEEDWFIAQCLEVDVASQGHTIDEALANLAEAVELYLEEVDDPAGHITATPLVTSFQLPAA